MKSESEKYLGGKIIGGIPYTAHRAQITLPTLVFDFFSVFMLSLGKVKVRFAPQG